MPNIEWFGPPRGVGSVEDIAAHQPEVIDELKVQARAIALSAEFLLDTLPKHRTGDAQIGMQWGNGSDESHLLDYYVYMSDPLHFEAAKSIEDGHWINGYASQRSKRLGSLEGPIRPTGPREWVPGLHPMQKALDFAVKTAKVS